MGAVGLERALLFVGFIVGKGAVAALGSSFVFGLDGDLGKGAAVLTGGGSGVVDDALAVVV